MALARFRPRRLIAKTSLFERIMALIALLNFGLVLFDLSYIPFRDYYLKFLPEFTRVYGATFKGIDDERMTTAYLEQVDGLIEQLQATGIDSVQVETILEDLQDRSNTLIDENPFEVANKSGTLERIKGLMREHTGKEDSSKAAFNAFWDQRRLARQGWAEDIEFFDRDVRPLFETNYWRGIDFSGLPIDRFWLLDGWFMLIFALEFFGRTYILSRRNPNTTWFDAMLWRAYDIPLLLGFWRWLRIIPVTIRLNQSHLFNLEPLRARLNRIVISQIAVELTEVVVLRIIDQTQNFIKDGKISQWIFSAASGDQKYIDLNGVDEIQTITQRLTTVLVYQVLPKIKPEFDALIRHSVTTAIADTPPYQGLSLVPGFNDLSDQISKQVVSELSKNLYLTLEKALSDERGGQLTQKLIASFSNHLQTEISKDHNLEEIQSLISDLLEEIKVNYVERIADEDLEALQANAYKLYGATQQGR